MLLLVEDDPILGPALAEGLRPHFNVELAPTLESARLALKARDFDLIVLDLSLPDGSGLSLLKDIRRGQNPAGVIIQSALDETPDRIAGLEMGADDYITKPYDLNELAARCHALRRRLRGHPTPIIRVGTLEFDPTNRTVQVDGNAVTLSATELRLLEILLGAKGRVLSKGQIEERLYDWLSDIESNTVEVYVSRLRRKLGAPVVRTVRGLGYMVSETP